MNDRQITPASAEQDKRDLIEMGKSLLSGENSRIGNGWFLILVIAALIADLLTLIPFAGDFIGPIFWVGVALFLWLKGCGFLNTARIATELIALVAKLIPVIQEFPETTIGIILVILLIRFEDRTGIKVAGAISEGGMNAVTQGGNQPFNRGGQRLPSGRGNGPANAGGVRQPYNAQSDEEEESEEDDSATYDDEAEQSDSFSYTDKASSPTETVSYEFGEPVRQGASMASGQHTSTNNSSSSEYSPLRSLEREPGMQETSSGSFIPSASQSRALEMHDGSSELGSALEKGGISDWHAQQNQQLMNEIEAETQAGAQQTDIDQEKSLGNEASAEKAFTTTPISIPGAEAGKDAVSTTADSAGKAAEGFGRSLSRAAAGAGKAAEQAGEMAVEAGKGLMMGL